MSSYLRDITLGVVDDFIERLVDPAGSDVGFDFLNEMIQAASISVRFNLLFPLDPKRVVKTMKQIPYGKKYVIIYTFCF